MDPIEDEIVIDTPDDSDAELDASINASIKQIRDENGQGTIVPTVEKSTETPAPEVVPQSPKIETPNESQTEAIDFTQPPKKGKFESDESYTMRVNLFDLIKLRKEATTPSEKDAIQQQMKALRSEMGEIARNSKQSLPNNDDVPLSEIQKTQIDPNDLDALIDQRLLSRQQTLEIKSVTDSFFEKHTELKDPDVRDVFIQFFDSNYKIEGKSAKEVGIVLDLARQAMFRPNETVQERVLKAAGVQEKVNAMQFPGGTIVKQGLTPAEQKSIDEIVATGMSEEKARALILD